ncbi:methionine--tRNA ligase [Photobacterium galatheae]|uniref:Methionine--tRNA ligase n=1 Tax=Photobacterium galatheae TaxID=1654360 RepID=A0A066RHR5_9GAMM|nr:methionyl-tRNA synthetase [Photobacterium galatheae]MCM0149973.1 methionine--tRNA ligase [Photobacterium galatheae]
MPRFLITSALPYINGIKHLGNLVGSLLPADVYARYLRQQQQQVLYICGTDEHGTPAELAATEHGLSTEDYCNKLHDLQRDIYQRFHISFDYFGRTSSKANHEITQSIYRDLEQRGFIKQKAIEQVYSIEDKRFLPDRYVEGTCPHCSDEKARGDQCDGCGQLLEPYELIDPHSAITGSKDLIIKQSNHYFLCLSKLQQDVGAWVDRHKHWSPLTQGIAKKWLQEGLQDRCISRDLNWGIPLPTDNNEKKVFYVWFDAPNGYISMTKEWAEKHAPDSSAWKDWWTESDDVHYTQFMAKDNVPFHTIFWPAVLMGAESNYKLVDNIKAFNWLLYEGGKFSTSQKLGVFMDDALELFPADYWRYYLLSNAPENSDSSFTFQHFSKVINKDLADNLGNFVSRVSALVSKYFSGQIPKEQLAAYTFPVEMKVQVKELLKDINDNYQQCNFRHLINCLKKLYALGNEYITKAEPWKILKNDEKAGADILSTCLILIRIMAVASAAVIPTTSEKLFAVLQLTQRPDALTIQDESLFATVDTSIKTDKALKLFEKITDKQVEDLTQRFGAKKSS